MPWFDSGLRTPIQLTANEILKIMYYSRAPEEVVLIYGSPMAGDLKIQPHWSAETLHAELRNGGDVSLYVVGEPLKMLHGENYITLLVGMPSGFDLLEKGRIEARRLGTKRA